MRTLPNKILWAHSQRLLMMSLSASLMMERTTFFFPLHKYSNNSACFFKRHLCVCDGPRFACLGTRVVAVLCRVGNGSKSPASSPWGIGVPPRFYLRLIFAVPRLKFADTIRFLICFLTGRSSKRCLCVGISTNLPASSSIGTGVAAVLCRVGNGSKSTASSPWGIGVPGVLFTRCIATGNLTSCIFCKCRSRVYFLANVFPHCGHLRLSRGNAILIDVDTFLSFSELWVLYSGALFYIFLEHTLPGTHPVHDYSVAGRRVL